MTARPGPAGPVRDERRRADLVTAGLDPEEIGTILDTALWEDLRYGPDVTTEATVPDGNTVTARLVSRAPGTLAGIVVVETLLSEVLTDPTIVPHHRDGDRVGPGTVVLEVRARARELLTVERTVLNLVCHLSGVATLTRSWVDAVAGTGCRIRDTRKTLPGLRTLQKYAVRCGGGTNHRLGLGDAVLVKDNHIAVAGSVSAAMAAVTAAAPDLPAEVEVDRIEQLHEAVAVGADLVLLDNWTVDQCAQGVRVAAGSRTRLEASGGLTLPVARAYAETGVDYLAVGALTHSAPGLDLGLDL
jgi:nicotinate-nucleotide pyrophosphorylase (carboxylating)